MEAILQISQAVPLCLSKHIVDQMLHKEDGNCINSKIVFPLGKYNIEAETNFIVHFLSTESACILFNA